MITNAICTVVRMNEDGGHDIIGVHPCMWQETEGYEVKKYGEENADKATVYIPDLTVDVRKGDYIYRGELTEVSDTSEMLVVMSVTRHDYGSKDMQHIRIGAR